MVSVDTLQTGPTIAIVTKVTLGLLSADIKVKKDRKQVPARLPNELAVGDTGDHN